MRFGVLLVLLAACSRDGDRVLATIPDGSELILPPAFTPDGRHVAYIVRTGSNYNVVRGDWISRRLKAI